jgi:flavodoxin
MKVLIVYDTVFGNTEKVRRIFFAPTKNIISTHKLKNRSARALLINMLYNP